MGDEGHGEAVLVDLWRVDLAVKVGDVLGEDVLEGCLKQGGEVIGDGPTHASFSFTAPSSGITSTRAPAKLAESSQMRHLHVVAGTKSMYWSSGMLPSCRDMYFQ